MGKGPRSAAAAAEVSGTDARVKFHGAANGETSKGTSHIAISSPTRGLSVDLIGNQPKHRHQILSSRVNLVSGPAGTGKTFVPVATGIELVHSAQSPIRNIVYVRTPVLAGGEKNPPVPGNEARKYARFIRPLTSVIESIMGEKERGRIEQQISEYGSATLGMGRVMAISPGDLRGDTLEDSLIILDEAGSASSQILELMVGRIGFNSKLVISGDPRQNDVTQPPRQMGDVAELVENFAELFATGLSLPKDKLDDFNQKVAAIKARYAPIEVTPFENMIVSARKANADHRNHKGLVSVFEYSAEDIVRGQDNADLLAILTPGALETGKIRALVKGAEASPT